MNFIQEVVRVFHHKFSLPAPTTPTIPEEQIAELRRRLIEEEVDELEYAMLDHDMVAIADAICDLLYVTYGCAVTYGIDIEEMFYRVHNCNMAKNGGGVRHDGKILKPKGWVGPETEIARLLYEQGWRKPE